MMKEEPKDVPLVGLWVTSEDWDHLKGLKSLVKVSSNYVRLSNRDMAQFFKASTPSINRMEYDFGVEYKEMPADWKSWMKENAWKQSSERFNGSKFAMIKLNF